MVRRLVAVGHTAVPVGHAGWCVGGSSKSYYSPSRAYWMVCVLVAMGYKAAPGGHTEWRTLVAVGCTAVPVDHTGGCVGWLIRQSR